MGLVLKTRGHYLNAGVFCEVSETLDSTPLHLASQLMVALKNIFYLPAKWLAV